MTDQFIDTDEVYNAIIEELKAQNAELLAALKLAVSKYEEEYKIGLDSYRAFFECDPDFEDPQWKVPEWVNAAKLAIEKAEKTLPL